MSRYRLRVELPDLPGALAKVATVISELDGDVVSIDIHELDGHQAIDELVVEVLTELDGRVLAGALERAGAGALALVRAREGRHRARPGCADLGPGDRRSAGRRRDHAGAGFGVSLVGGLDRARSTKAREVAAGRLALARGAPLVQRCLDLPPRLGKRGNSPMWLLAVPDALPHPRSIAFLARPGSLRFTASEVARVDALMAINRSAVESTARRGHPAATGYSANSIALLAARSRRTERAASRRRRVRRSEEPNWYLGSSRRSTLRRVVGEDGSIGLP